MALTFSPTLTRRLQDASRPSNVGAGSRPSGLSTDPLLLPANPSLSTPPSLGPGGSVFNDPYTSLFETLSKNAMARLSAPVQDDTLDEVMNLIRSRISSGGPAAPSFTGNAYMGQYADTIQKRIGELNAEPFSAAEEDRLKTGALEAVEKNRSSSKRRAIESVSRRGIADTSGILLEMERDIDRGADSDRAVSEREFANFVTSERNRRRDAAAGLSGQLAAAGAADAAMANQNSIAGANFGLAKEQQVMSMATQLAGLAAQKRGEARANQNDILAIANTLMNIAPQRLALMQNIVSGQTSPGEVFNNTLNLSNTQYNQQQNTNANNAAMMSGIGQVLAYLAANGRSGGGNAVPTGAY
jgi:hypothetical protein